MSTAHHVKKTINTIDAINGTKLYCLRIRLAMGNKSPTRKFPDQLATLIADIMIGLGPTSVSSYVKNKKKNKTINRVILLRVV